MLDQNQLYQLGSLHRHAQAAKNDRELKAQAEKQIELLEEQKLIEKKKLWAAQDKRDAEIKRAEDEAKHREEQARLTKLTKERLKSVRNVLADADKDVGFIIADLDLNLVNEARNKIPSLTHDRDYSKSFPSF